MLAFVDVETTGLDPKEGCLLEVAALVTSDDLVPLDEGISFVVEPIFGCLEKMNKVVEDMHMKNGLLTAVKNADPVHRRFEVDHLLTKYLSGHTARTDGKHEKVPMAGSSVHFDRAWLKVHMPGFENLFSYRNVDVSTLKELWARWKRPGAPERQKGEVAHRSMLDVMASIDELVWYREHWLKPSYPEARS